MATAAKESRETAVALATPKQLSQLLQHETARERIAPMLRGVEYNQIVGECYLAASDNPDILKCQPASIVAAVARACSWGLTIGETVHLVPFGNKLKAVQDFKGKVELIVAAGAAKSINAQCVYENEVFEYEQGTSPTIRHIPQLVANKRGVLIGAYAVADHGIGKRATIFYMPLADIDHIRHTHSKAWKKDACPPWYARKTVVHQLAKMLPKNAKLQAVMRQFEEDETDLDDVAAEALPAGGPVRMEEAPIASEPRDSRCICDRETGEVEPNCPVHGDFAGE